MHDHRKSVIDRLVEVKYYLRELGKEKEFASPEENRIWEFRYAVGEAIALLKEQEGTIKELQNAYGYLQKQLFEAQDKPLKEQEPMQPKRIDGKRNHFIKCGNCNYDLLTGFQFCPHCGQAVKWDD